MKKREKRRVIVDKCLLLKLAHPHKLKIIQLLEKQNKMNQREINKNLDISYRQTRRLINELSDMKILNKKKSKKTFRNPVFISLRQKK